MRLFSILLLSFCSLFVEAQTFPCDGSFYITLYDNSNGPTNAFQIDYNGNTVDFNLVEDYDIGFNSIGFNALDNYIYAIRWNTNDIVRLKSDGTYEMVGEESSIPSWVSGAGDCNLNGEYWVHHRPTKKFYSYNVTGGFSQIDEIECTWHPSTGNSGVLDLDLDDFAFDPTDPNSIYTFQRSYANGSEPLGTRGHLLRIDNNPASATYKQVFSMGAIPPTIIRHLGAMFFDYEGTLFAYGSLPPISSINQKRLVQIDKTNGSTILIGEGPSAGNNDGCSCPLNINLNKAAFPQAGDCATPFFQYEFEVTNASNQALSNLVFTDFLPSGMEILAISEANPFGGDIQSGSGVGTGSLIVNNINIVAGAILQFSIEVSNPGSGSFNNQATLTGIPAELGGQVVSDDPNTPEFEDATTIEIEGFEYGADLEVASGSAVNCDSLDTGYLAVSAEHILPNTDYYFSYFDNQLGQTFGAVITANADGWVWTYNLSPGTYTNLQIGPSEDCLADLSFTGFISYPLIEGPFFTGGTSQVCEGGTIIVGTTSDPDATYDWTGPGTFTWDENNFTIDNAKLSDAGTYHVLIEKFGCFQEDSITVTVFESPTVDLGSDTSYCEGQTVLLLPDVTSTSAVDYFWSTLSTQAFESITTTNSYRVRVTDSNGCDARDTIFVEFLPEPMLDLGADQFICELGDLELSAGTNLSYGYEWSDGSMTASIFPSSYGEYAVTVNNEGCAVTDLILIEPFEELPTQDLTVFYICDGAGVTVDLNLNALNVLVEWSDGTFGQSNYFDLEGIYSYAISEGDCVYADTFEVLQSEILMLDLGNDTTICNGEFFSIDVENSSATYYQWQNGSTNASYFVNQTGQYWVTMGNDECQASDTINVAFIEIIGNQLDNSAELCEGDSLWLVVNDFGATYEWSTGSTNDSLLVTTTGEYWVAISEGECIELDTIDVFFSVIPALDFPNDTLICEDSTLLINTNGSGAVTFEWQNGSTLPYFEIEISGTYSLIASNGDCIVADSLTVTFYDCTICEFYIPNAFTPNFDGTNDDFSAYTNCELLDYEIQIFNRWGGKVYEGNDIDIAWDGSDNGKIAQVGVYTYLINVTYEELLEIKVQQFSGDVTLIR